MVDLLELIRREARVLKNAPGSVMLLMIAAAMAGGVVINFYSAHELANARSELAIVRAQLDDMKDRRASALEDRQFYLDCLEKRTLSPKCPQATDASTVQPDQPVKPGAAGEAPSASKDAGKPPAAPQNDGAGRVTGAGRPPSANSQTPRTPIYGVLHLDESKLRIALKRATANAKCTSFAGYATSTCYSYRIYLGGVDYAAADKVDVKVEYPAEYEFKIVVSPTTEDIVPTFENTCAGDFKITGPVTFMEFTARFEQPDSTNTSYRIRDCALIGQ